MSPEFDSTDAKRPSDTQPLVTFAIFAYNQQQYIKEAIEGAFAQTYSPLEIILSDDCSQDATFEIMASMAASYVGPHTIRARKTPRNNGLWNHVAQVAREAKGSYIVMAAGDDVSLPNRTSVAIEAIQRNNAQALASNFVEIDESGKILRQNVENNYTSNELWKYINFRKDCFISGATSVYSLHFLIDACNAIKSAPFIDSLYNEDQITSAFAIASDAKIVELKSPPLVKYRLVTNSLSNFKAKGSLLQKELNMIRRERFYSRSRLAVICAIEEMAKSYPQLSAILVQKELHKQRRLSEIEILSSAKTLPERLRALMSVRSMSEFKISIVRLFGIKAQAALRTARQFVPLKS